MNFGNSQRKCVKAYQTTGNVQLVSFKFAMKVGTIIITCRIISNLESAIISIPCFDPRMGQFTEMGYGEYDFMEDIQELIDIIDSKDMGDYAFYNAFDMFVMKHIQTYGRLIDTDLFRIVAELILMMQALATKNGIDFTDSDKVDITKIFVNRALENFSDKFYVTRYRRNGFEMEAYIEKYRRTYE